eukprot:699014-Pelagomonas_calceolata.AAC.1
MLVPKPRKGRKGNGYTAVPPIPTRLQKKEIRLDMVNARHVESHAIGKVRYQVQQVLQTEPSEE